MSPAKPAPAAKAPSQRVGLGDWDRPADGLLDAAAIRRLRLQAGYSTRRFARALGVSASTVRGLEDGSNHQQLPLTLIAQLAELVGVATRELFARATDEPADPAPTTASSKPRSKASPQSSLRPTSPEHSAGSSNAHAEQSTHSTGAYNRPARGCTATAGSSTRSDPPATTYPISSSRRCIASAHATAASTTSPHDCCSPPPAANSTTAGSRRPQTANAWPCRACSSKAPSSRSPARPRSSPPPTRPTGSTPTCANSQRRTSCAHPAGGFHSPVYAQSSAGRKTTRPTPTRLQLLNNSRHLAEELATSALNNS